MLNRAVNLRGCRVGIVEKGGIGIACPQHLFIAKAHGVGTRLRPLATAIKQGSRRPLTTGEC